MTFLRGRLGSLGGSRCSALPAEGSCTEAVAKGCEKGLGFRVKFRVPGVRGLGSFSGCREVAGWSIRGL